ncbi:SRPBCC family protein [Streptomyces sp. NBC_01216]|uniref:SRPBCC family protein n=1 Tax=unclassified Streptomyces TaxID=2593676 RepID=UPI002E14098F|nr:SRPBCC family protein [Streptomyces sp. NBC_01216]
MSVFRIERVTALPAGEAWRRLTDWPSHGGRVPLTRTRVLTPGPTAPGTRFVARTGLGRLAFDDPMEVVRWEPPVAEPGGPERFAEPAEPGGPGRPGSPSRPAVCRLEKRGRVVRGHAVIEVYAAGRGGSHAVWVEELRVRGVPGLLDPVVSFVGRRVFGRVMDGLLGI